MLTGMLPGAETTSTEEVFTFQPARLHLPGMTADVLLDSLGPQGGCFYVMTDGEQFSGRLDFNRERYFSGLDEVELEWRNGSKAWSLPSKVIGYSLDEEGVAAYMMLRFEERDLRTHRLLEDFKSSLW
jgi:hypothetical protein